MRCLLYIQWNYQVGRPRLEKKNFIQNSIETMNPRWDCQGSTKQKRKRSGTEFWHNIKFRGCENEEKVANVTKQSSQYGENPQEYGPNFYTILDAGDIKMNKFIISALKVPSLVTKTNV